MERHLGEDHLRGDAFALVRGGEPGELVARLQLVRLGEHLAEALEAVVPAEERGLEFHELSVVSCQLSVVKLDPGAVHLTTDN